MAEEKKYTILIGAGGTGGHIFPAIALAKKFIDNNFKGNKTYKKLVSSSVFCSEDNNIIHDDFKINKEQKIGIIPPIGGG